MALLFRLLFILILLAGFIVLAAVALEALKLFFREVLPAAIGLAVIALLIYAVFAIQWLQILLAALLLIAVPVVALRHLVQHRARLSALLAQHRALLRPLLLVSACLLAGGLFFAELLPALWLAVGLALYTLLVLLLLRPRAPTPAQLIERERKQLHRRLHGIQQWANQPTDSRIHDQLLQLTDALAYLVDAVMTHDHDSAADHSDDSPAPAPAYAFVAPELRVELLQFVRSNINHTLPQVLKAYFRLPARYRTQQRVHGDRSSQDILLQQLQTLHHASQQRIDELHRHSADAIEQSARFVQGKYGQANSSLKL